MDFERDIADRRLQFFIYPPWQVILHVRNKAIEFSSLLTDDDVAFLHAPFPVPPSQVTMMAYFRRWVSIIDKIFSNNLANHIELYFADAEDGDDHVRETTFGWTEVFRCQDGRGHAIIRLRRRESIEPCETKRWQSYLETIIHELVHAFVYLYCPYPQQNPTNQGEQTSLDVFGRSGHGRGWCQIANSVEIALSQTLPYQLDLAIKDSIEAENEASGWIPTGHELRQWGLKTKKHRMPGGEVRYELKKASRVTFHGELGCNPS